MNLLKIIFALFCMVIVAILVATGAIIPLGILIALAYVIKSIIFHKRPPKP